MFKIPFEQFTESLNVDKNLKLSRNDLADEVKRRIKIEHVPKFEKLKSIQEFPSTRELASLSWKVYENLDKQILPEGWELLLTACNKEISNGYYGAVFLQPQRHQVIVAHRGTELSNIGSAIADIAGILLNNCGGQMESACTFADKVVQTLKEIESENEDVHFEIFFTGHR